MPCQSPRPVPTCPGSTATGALIYMMCPVCKGKANLRARRGSIAQLAQDPLLDAPALQGGWTDRAITIVQDLYTELLVGGPPCPYAFCITGSGARREACPYSDLDCFIVVDAGASPANKQAFVDASRLVKERLEFQEWDRDRHQPGQGVKGLIFCNGGLNPGGWNVIGLQIPRLVCTAVEFAGILEENITNHHAALEHVVSGLQESGFGFGTQALYTDLQREVNLIMGQTCWKMASRPALTHKKRGGLDAIREVVTSPDYAIPAVNATRINIKKSFYRMPQFVVKGLAWYYGIQEVVTARQLDALVAANRMSNATKTLFTDALDAPLKIRVLSHLHGQDESDWVRTAAHVGANPNNEYVLSNAEAQRLVALIGTLTTIKRKAERFLAQKNKVIGKRKNPFVEA